MQSEFHQEVVRGGKKEEEEKSDFLPSRRLNCSCWHASFFLKEYLASSGSVGRGPVATSSSDDHRAGFGWWWLHGQQTDWCGGDCDWQFICAVVIINDPHPHAPPPTPPPVTACPTTRFQSFDGSLNNSGRVRIQTSRNNGQYNVAQRSWRSGIT